MSDITEDRLEDRLEHRVAEFRRTAEHAFSALRGDDNGGSDGGGNTVFIPWFINILTTPRDLEILAGEIDVMTSMMKAVTVSVQTLQAGFAA